MRLVVYRIKPYDVKTYRAYQIECTNPAVLTGPTYDSRRDAHEDYSS